MKIYGQNVLKKFKLIITQAFIDARGYPAPSALWRPAVNQCKYLTQGRADITQAFSDEIFLINWNWPEICRDVIQYGLRPQQNYIEFEEANQFLMVLCDAS